MSSSGHRSNILKPAYRELGIGVRVGTPREAGVGATYTIEFGVTLSARPSRPARAGTP